MSVCAAVEMSRGDDTVQLRYNGQLRVDLRRGTLPSHAAVRVGLLGEQRCPLVHRLRMESVIFGAI